MKNIQRLVEPIVQLVERASVRPLRWYCLLIVVAAAAPLGVELAFLVDLVGAIGVDVLVLSTLYYVADSVFASARIWLRRGAVLFEKSGGVLPRRRGSRSRREWLLCVGHNLCVLVTPVRFAALGLVCLAIPSLFTWASLASLP